MIKFKFYKIILFILWEINIQMIKGIKNKKHLNHIIILIKLQKEINFLEKIKN